MVIKRDVGPIHGLSPVEVRMTEYDLLKQGWGTQAVADELRRIYPGVAHLPTQHTVAKNLKDLIEQRIIERRKRVRANHRPRRKVPEQELRQKVDTAMVATAAAYSPPKPKAGVLEPAPDGGYEAIARRAARLAINDTEIADAIENIQRASGNLEEALERLDGLLEVDR